MHQLVPSYLLQGDKSMLSQVSDSGKKSFIKINLGIRNDLQVFHKEFPRCYVFVQLMSYDGEIR